MFGCKMPNGTSELPSNVVANTIALYAMVPISSTNIQPAHLPCCYGMCGSKCLSVIMYLDYSSGLSPHNIMFKMFYFGSGQFHSVSRQLEDHGFFIIFIYYNLKSFRLSEFYCPSLFMFLAVIPKYSVSK